MLRDARALGLLGPGPLDPHLAHARAFARVLVRAYAQSARSSTGGAGSQPDTVLDLGSGGGLPGLVLAVSWPHTRLTLLDAQHRRIAFLTEAAARLGVSTRVAMLEGRAEDLGHRPTWRGQFDAVVARSFGRPAVTAECAAPFLRPGGILVVSEPPAGARDPETAPVDGERTPRASGSDPGAGAGADGSTRWPPTGLAMLGMDPAAPVDDEFQFVVVRQRTACPERFPRRVGVPAKRPLF